MAKVEGHLVGFGAASDLEEAEQGYSEIDGDLPSGTCRYNETKFNEEGRRYLVNPDKDGYEARKSAFLREQGLKTTIPKWLREKLKKYEVKGLNLWALATKFQDGFSRREVVRKLKEAKTKEEKIQILEEFHKGSDKSRKQTALKLKAMEDIRRIRQEMAKRIAEKSRD